MANEINYKHTETGVTLYATVETPAGTIWNGAAFEAMLVANWATYAVALTESPAGGYRYIGSAPALAAGTYTVRIFKQAGGSPAIADTCLAEGDLSWSGTAENAGLTENTVMEGTLTVKSVLRILLAFAVGKTTGCGTTAPKFRDQADTKNRISGTVDASGNRTAVTLDATD